MNESLLEKELFLRLVHFISPETPYSGVIRRSTIRTSQVLGFLANQARYRTVFWQVGHPSYTLEITLNPHSRYSPCSPFWMMLFMNEPLLKKELFLCLAHFISPEAPYAGVIRRSAIRASQVLGFLANQARYGTVFWQVGHLQSSFSRSHSRSDRPKKEKKSLLIFPKEWVMDLFLFFSWQIEIKF